MQAWDDRGQEVRDQVGELVVTRPMPMPVSFWDDSDGRRYHEAYFSTFPGVWRHGDWVTVTGRGSVVVHGRSDATLNRNGVRMGSADIYNAIEPLPMAVEALVIRVEQQDGSYWMPRFVVLHDDAELDAGRSVRTRRLATSRTRSSRYPHGQETGSADQAAAARSTRRHGAPARRDRRPVPARTVHPLRDRA